MRKTRSKQMNITRLQKELNICFPIPNFNLRTEVEK